MFTAATRGQQTVRIDPSLRKYESSNLPVYTELTAAIRGGGPVLSLLQPCATI